MSVTNLYRQHIRCESTQLSERVSMKIGVDDRNVMERNDVMEQNDATEQNIVTEQKAFAFLRNVAL